MLLDVIRVETRSECPLGLLLAPYGYVLENGELSLEGKTADLLDNDDVKRAYPII